MSALDPIPAPLEASDPARARALKAKVHDRVSDVRRHLLALRTAMAEFGEDFDLHAFRTGYASEDPIELNRVKAVERGVEQLYNYIAQLAAFGLELAELRPRRDETNVRRDLDAMRHARVLSGELTRRLQRLRELRRMLAHDTQPPRPSRSTGPRSSWPPTSRPSMRHIARGSSAGSAQSRERRLARQKPGSPGLHPRGGAYVFMRDVPEMAGEGSRGDTRAQG
jgi:hypothetical protein